METFNFDLLPHEQAQLDELFKKLFGNDYPKNLIDINKFNRLRHRKNLYLKQIGKNPI